MYHNKLNAMYDNVIYYTGAQKLQVTVYSSPHRAVKNPNSLPFPSEQGAFGMDKKKQTNKIPSKPNCR